MECVIGVKSLNVDFVLFTAETNRTYTCLFGRREQRRNKGGVIWRE